MRYVQLRAFHYVATTGGFSRAADKLGITQPAVSDQIRKLEEEYDVLLFTRQRKHITLTPFGEQLLSITHKMFDIEAQAQSLLSESSAFRSGNLRIIADSAYHVLPILGAFRKKHPYVRVTIRTGNTESVVQSLLNYETDIGVLGEIPTNPVLKTVILSSSPIVAFAPLSHPAAASPSLRLCELAKHPLVMREKGSKTRAKLEQAAMSAGVKLEAAIEVEGREAVRELVASGAGVGFVSLVEYGHDPRLAKIDIAGPALLMDEALVCLSERSQNKLIRTFFEIALALSDESSHRNQPSIESK